MTNTRWGGLAARVRLYEFIPELALAVGLGLFALTEPHAAASGLKSMKAIVLMAVVAIAWIVGRLALWTGVRWPAVRLAVFAVAAAAILKVVVLPAYDDHTVIEALPVDTTSAATASTATSTISAGTQPTSPSAPVKVKSGDLRGIDHRATGTAALYVATDGHGIVGLEQFDIQPGPAYVLYLVSGTGRRDHDGGTRLESLRGNKGTQFYDAPSGIDVSSGDWTVLVWCETFDVPVAHATPTAI